MKRPLTIVALAACLLVAASGALAQGRDAADRALRSDHDAMRNEVGQDRLNKPATPLLPPWQEPPVVDKKPKSKRTGQKAHR